MADVTLAAPPLTYMTWGCRRCGFAGGMARTTIPLTQRWSEEMGREMFATLRKKLVRVHQAKQGCIAVPDDFILSRYDPRDGMKKVVGLI